MISVLTPGSPGVAPYTESDARFAIEESQFEVADQRPMEVILDEHVAAGITFDGYEPATSCGFHDAMISERRLSGCTMLNQSRLRSNR